MSNKNMVKIICNPYTNNIDYKFWDIENEGWNSFYEGSMFNDDKFINTALQKVAYDIVKELKDNYSPGTTGLNIIFEGTNEDYEHLKDIINSYFSDTEIELTRGKRYLLSAVDVKKNIESIFQGISKNLYTCSNKEVKELIEKYTETVCPTIPLCVMGLYSAGKSAFINALLGVELLPSASDPTTAKIYKIVLGDKNEIRFEWLKDNDKHKKIALMFDGNEYRISSPETIELVCELNKIKKYDTTEERMYHAVEIINRYDSDKNKPKGEEKIFIDDLIEITLNKKTVGFSGLYSNNYNFVLYDTPGSNSATNKNHTEVLKEAMKEQTNGLPIYVTSPDEMDTNDNTELIKTLDECAKTLDKSNLIIIVNKADEKSNATLLKKKDNYSKLGISNLHSAGTYFISSPVGLGCKKLLFGNTTIDEEGKNFPKFIDEDYEEVFGKIAKFENVNEKGFKKLYDYNIVPKKQYDDYSKLSMDKKYFAYRNSGLHAIESAIIEFSDKYALYNKCKNASDYLSKAIEILSESIAAAEEEKEGLSKKLKLKMDDKQRTVLEELTDVCNSMEGELMTEYSRSQEENITESLKEIKGELVGKLKKIRWDGWSKEKRLQGEAIWEAVARMINDLLKRKVDIYCDKNEETARHMLDSYGKSLKEKLSSVITNSDNLTEEQRGILKESIQGLRFDCWGKPQRIDWKEIYTGLFGTFNLNEAQNKFVNNYHTYISKFNVDIKEVLRKSANNYRNDVEKSFNDLVQKYNPDICKLNEEWQKCVNEIQDLRNQQDKIKNSKNKVAELTEFKMTIDNEKRQ